MPRTDTSARDRNPVARAHGKDPGDDADIDRTLADSFPASDPPSWTPGVAIAREPQDSTRNQARRSSSRGGGEAK